MSAYSDGGGGSLLTGLKTRLRLSLASTMAIPALRRFSDYLNQTSTSLPSGSPVWLLGDEYTLSSDEGPSAATGRTQVELLVLSFYSLPWMTYRRDFPVLPGGYTSDVGWGCTLRSGQMLLARALLVHFYGRDWRLAEGLPGAVPAPVEPLSASQLVDIAEASAAPSDGQADSSASDGRQRASLEDGAAASASGRAALQQGPAAATTLDDAVVVAAPPGARHSELLRWFADSAAQPFSLHALVAAGAPHGVVAGQWLGPHALCQTLAALVEGACGGQVRVHVATSGGGGAPTIYRELPPRPNARAAGAAAGAGAAGAGAADGAAAATSSDTPDAGAPSGDAAADPKPTPTPGGEQNEAAVADAAQEPAAEAAQPPPREEPAPSLSEPAQSAAEEDATATAAEPRSGGAPSRLHLPEALLSPAEQAPEADLGWSPLVVLVPLVLGLGKQINPAYLPQLRATFRLPQSLGIVGGKPGSSLYFVGCQEESESVVYLDPHEVQPAEDPSAPRGAFPTGSFHCAQLRHTPMTTMDPSLALAFYARTQAEYKDLCDRLEELVSRAAPLLTVEQRQLPPTPHRSSFRAKGRGGGGGGAAAEGSVGGGGAAGGAEDAAAGGEGGEGEGGEEHGGGESGATEEEGDWEMI